MERAEPIPFSSNLLQRMELLTGGVPPEPTPATALPVTTTSKRLAMPVRRQPRDMKKLKPQRRRREIFLQATL
ncbi:hypothetical protein MUO93_09070 [Candidatus Bathyarchaeota archaeon]|jgi:hypothetical protein|nr:hypothetical protein [Candidatus Bathyarchaeota archaeon]